MYNNLEAIKLNARKVMGDHHLYILKLLWQRLVVNKDISLLGKLNKISKHICQG